MSSQFVYVPTVRYFSSTELSKILGIEKNYRGLACGKNSIINDIVFKFKARMESFKSFGNVLQFLIGDWRHREKIQNFGCRGKTQLHLD